MNLYFNSMEKTTLYILNCFNVRKFKQVKVFTTNTDTILIPHLPLLESRVYKPRLGAVVVVNTLNYKPPYQFQLPAAQRPNTSPIAVTGITQHYR
jgi:hypothetical protein